MSISLPGAVVTLSTIIWYCKCADNWWIPTEKQEHGNSYLQLTVSDWVTNLTSSFYSTFWAHNECPWYEEGIGLQLMWWNWNKPFSLVTCRRNICVTISNCYAQQSIMPWLPSVFALADNWEIWKHHWLVVVASCKRTMLLQASLVAFHNIFMVAKVIIPMV